MHLLCRVVYILGAFVKNIQLTYIAENRFSANRRSFILKRVLNENYIEFVDTRENGIIPRRENVMQPMPHAIKIL